MRLAPRETERLWKGLERFVNCRDSEGDYQDLGRAFPSFWPVTLHYWTELREGGITCTKQIPLDWNPVCHKLFLFYRDLLRRLWLKERDLPTELLRAPEFLVGIEIEWHRLARESAEAAEKGWTLQQSCPEALVDAWKEILQRFPNAQFGSPALIGVRWPSSDFFVEPKNDFQRAFYHLFRQSWRARLCPRCEDNRYFIAQKAKQKFCGTRCSAGNRLASKRKWWREQGRKARARQRGRNRRKER
jgi:hypothetical protein